MMIPRSVWFCKDTLLAHSAVGQLLDADPVLRSLWGPRWTAGLGKSVMQSSTMQRHSVLDARCL